MINQRQVNTLKRMLTGLPKKIRNKILREELRRAAKTLIAPSRTATPVRTGQLRKSVKVRSVKSRGNKAIQFGVGYSGKNFQGDTFYGSFLEFGWKVGKRPSRASKALDTRKKIPARRMLGKVAESKGPALLSSAANRIIIRIQQEAKNG